MVSSGFNIIKELFGIKDAKGFSEEEINQVRSLHGRIPLDLERYYRELGRDEKVNHTQNNLIIPWEYTWPESKSHLIIYAENQGVCFWGISLNDLARDNPPVYVTFDNVYKEPWELESNSLSEFLIAMAHVHAGFALSFTSDEIYMISESEADIIRKSFQKKCEPLMQWVDSGVEFYGNYPCDSIVVMRNADAYDLYYASGNEVCFNEMDSVLFSLGESY